MKLELIVADFRWCSVNLKELSTRHINLELDDRRQGLDQRETRQESWMYMSFTYFQAHLDMQVALVVSLPNRFPLPHQKLLERRERYNGPERLQIDIFRRGAQCPVRSRESTHVVLSLNLFIRHEIRPDGPRRQARSPGEQVEHLLDAHLVARDTHGAPVERVPRRIPKRCDSETGDVDVVDDRQPGVRRHGRGPAAPVADLGVPGRDLGLEEVGHEERRPQQGVVLEAGVLDRPLDRLLAVHVLFHEGAWGHPYIVV